ncbi:EamA family transporter [Reichenbachiella agarivorans]|uniref:EamA family transporter n=1 Tax=Reichenbachiella agarivorans TaxID=2979464 RepID=A0ABY6CP94_9BACT|nr:EamA family transporter [Reichenbachiella agarivorans]UXP32351.1 EamA family transporter [Reichenbachiella agarivorans]
MWVILGVLSLLALGVYDILKKVSLNDNAVLPVLFFSTVFSALLFVPPWIMSYTVDGFDQYDHFYIPPVDLHVHLLIVIKVLIVVSSWILSFLALKNLPISIVSPIRSTGPIWTLMGAIMIYGETLNQFQWIGMMVALIFFYFFSIAGNKEGVNFKTNKWVWFILLATLIGTVSTLYDKFLIANYNRLAIQAYFSFYQVPIMALVLLIFWYPKREKYTPFRWKYTIPFIGIVLVLGDFAYFYALTFEDSLVSILSLLRRSSVIISFAAGAILFKEKNILHKSLILLGIIIGIVLIMVGS